jgi:serine protease Do
MDNENKWEYDYSNLYGSSAGNTGSSNNSGYVNVGSSGTNAANQYDSAASASSSSYNSYSNYTEPTPQPSAPQNHTPKKKKHFNAGKAARSVVALVLAAAMGFVGGYVGSSLNSDSSSKVIVQSVQRDTSALNATSTSTGGSDLTLPQVSALVTPSVVVITTEQVVYSTWSWYGQSQVQSGAGSGVIISSDGYVLTCDHVISGASNIIVTIDDVDYTATVVGEDSDSDIAVLKIDATGLTPAVMGDSDALAVGEGAVAVGNPLGELGGTVTNGIISALNRSVSVEGKTMNLIQTNASVSPGNSGGGLFNMAGELIGIVNAKSSDEDAEGLGFAIPINTAMQIAQDLLENGYVTGRPALGVTVLAVTDSSTAQQYGVSTYGVYIVGVTEGGGAANAGLQAGDRIVSIENTEVTANDDLTNVIQEHQVGDTLSIVVARNGQMLTFDVTLGEKNATASTSTQSETDSAENGTESEPDNESGATTESNGDANGSNGSQGGTFPGFGRNAG